MAVDVSAVTRVIGYWPLEIEKKDVISGTCRMSTGRIDEVSRLRQTSTFKYQSQLLHLCSDCIEEPLYPDGARYAEYNSQGEVGGRSACGLNDPKMQQTQTIWVGFWLRSGNSMGLFTTAPTVLTASPCTNRLWNLRSARTNSGLDRLYGQTAPSFDNAGCMSCRFDRQIRAWASNWNQSCG